MKKYYVKKCICFCYWKLYDDENNVIGVYNNKKDIIDAALKHNNMQFVFIRGKLFDGGDR